MQRRIAFLLLLCLPFASSAQDIRAALNAYSGGDYALAISQARPLAERGNAVAQGLLGVMYEYGQGVPKDYREALSWYRKAANKAWPLPNSAWAQLTLRAARFPKTNRRR